MAAAPSAELAAMKIELAELKKLMHKKTATTGTPPPTSTQPPWEQRKSYCWTHGTSRNTRHNSKTCRAKADGHQDESTDANKMGGSEKVWTAPIAPRE